MEVSRNLRAGLCSRTPICRAYITEGWATQFLQRLFSRDDFFCWVQPSRHVAELSCAWVHLGFTGAGRFALTQPGDDARWMNLGITPVHYPPSPPPEGKHSELGSSLSAWAEQSNAGALGAEERIRSITEKGIPLLQKTEIT